MTLADTLMTLEFSITPGARGAVLPVRSYRLSCRYGQHLELWETRP